jgi:hypothetical protein
MADACIENPILCRLLNTTEMSRDSELIAMSAAGSVTEGVFKPSVSVLYSVAAAVAPDDAVQGFKSAAIDCVS